MSLLKIFPLIVRGGAAFPLLLFVSALAAAAARPEPGFHQVSLSECAARYCIEASAPHASISNFDRILAAANVPMVLTDRVTGATRVFFCASFTMHFKDSWITCDLPRGRTLSVQLDRVGLDLF